MEEGRSLSARVGLSPASIFVDSPDAESIPTMELDDPPTLKHNRHFALLVLKSVPGSVVVLLFTALSLVLLFFGWSDNGVHSSRKLSLQSDAVAGP